MPAGTQEGVVAVDSGSESAGIARIGKGCATATTPPEEIDYLTRRVMAATMALLIERAHAELEAAVCELEAKREEAAERLAVLHELLDRFPDLAKCAAVEKTWTDEPRTDDRLTNGHQTLDRVSPPRP